MTQEQFDQVVDFATLHFTEGQISLITGFDMNHPDFAKAIQKGYLLSEAKVRKSIFQLAESGSAPAQALALKIIKTKKMST